MSRLEFSRLKVGDQIQADHAMFGVPKNAIGIVARSVSAAPGGGWEIRWLRHPKGRRIFSLATLCWDKDVTKLERISGAHPIFL